MKQYLLITLILLALRWAGFSQSDQQVQGTILASDSNEPLVGVTVLVKSAGAGTVSDTNGRFQLKCSAQDTLVFSYIGYQSVEIPVGDKSEWVVHLEVDTEVLSTVEVYSTGYQQLPPERATGSFAWIDKNLLQRSTSTDIISRLENITPGLLFDRRTVSDATGMDQRNLRIRGVTSIESDNSPLIVVDHFPYEGDLNNINPNDVESITVLRDAAAASIWGARAANGVIVITLKQGKKNQPLSVSFSTNVTMSERPDLHYTPEFIPAADYIGLEKELFHQGFYNSDETSASHPALSPVIELLIAERDQNITSEELNSALSNLAEYDVRNQTEKYFYRQSWKQQHALSLSGGSEKTQHYLSTGYDHNLASIAGNELSRVSIVSKNTFKPMESLALSMDLAFTDQNQTTNGLSWGSIGTNLPYNRFADDDGNWLPITNTLRTSYLDEMEQLGFLDWQYRPLQEKALKDITNKSTEYRISPGLAYGFGKHMKLNLNYQYQQINTRYHNLQDKESYYVRHQVNRFTQQDGSQPFPYGDILTQRMAQQLAHSGRAQLNYHHELSPSHAFVGLLGIEARQVQTQGYGMQAFGYDDQVLTYNNQLDYTTRYPVLPRGSVYLPQPDMAISDMIDRYLSWFANASYTLKNKYLISGSARYDASNLFGVKTNQKGVPLWSVGAGWTLSNEQFYHAAQLPYLKLRATYGYNGNINKSVTAYPTAVYSSDIETGLPTAILKSAGNPQLRWEKVGMLNLGIDFESRKERLAGSIEFYHKNGKDIIGESPLDPTSGSGNMTNYINYAETQTNGVDLQITSVNLKRSLVWSTNWIWSYTSNKILKFYDESITNNNIRSGLSSNSSILPHQNKSVDALYSTPWWGLEHDSGDPLIMIDEELVKDYRDYVRALTLDDLMYHGVSVAPFFGAVRNNFSWNNLSLSLNISWRAGYYFRKSALSYTDLINYGEMHRDYVSRWQNPGDEAHTNVPSFTTDTDSYRDFIYTASEVLIEKGDHIRLEDINLSYTLKHRGLPFKELKMFVYAKNLGILWQASKSGLDPDYPNATYRSPRTYSIGLNATF